MVYLSRLAGAPRRACGRKGLNLNTIDGCTLVQFKNSVIHHNRIVRVESLGERMH